MPGHAWHSTIPRQDGSVLRRRTPPEVRAIDVVEDTIRRGALDDHWNGNYRVGANQILYALQEEGHRVIYKRR